jgi:hypothetical protein
VRSYSPRIALNARSLYSKNRPGLRSGSCRNRREHIIGVVVSETSSDTTIATDSVIENSRK